MSKSMLPPARHPIPWDNPSFYDEAALDEEMRRVADICHLCRRCFNVCGAFPRLFELIDNAPSGELDTVPSEAFGTVVEACTLCDLCYMTKCPYIPPHPWEVDFPHLMLRYRATEVKKGEASPTALALAHTERNLKIAAPIAPLVNWASDVENPLTRPLLEKVLGIDRKARLPKFAGETLVRQYEKSSYAPNPEAPGYGRKAVFFTTCSINYTEPGIGMAAAAVLAHNGVQLEMIYPGCCGMPLFEAGQLPKVAEKARKISDALLPWIAKGYDIISLIPSCSLMLKSHWRLLLPEDSGIAQVAAATYDLTEYVVHLAETVGLMSDMREIPEDVHLHIACHARAQHMGYKAAEMLRLLPGSADINVIAQCSGHGGLWGIRQDNFELAAKVGRPLMKTLTETPRAFVATECPLAAEQIRQDISGADVCHPIQLMATAYGLYKEREK